MESFAKDDPQVVVDAPALPAAAPMPPPTRRRVRFTTRWSHYLITASLLLIWLYVIIGLPFLAPTPARGASLPLGWPLQLASWLTFLALFITPGWLAADMLTGRLGLDWLERLALAFPLGIAILALPGMAALLLHFTLAQLIWLWIIAVLLLFLSWLALSGWHWWRRDSAPPSLPRWTVDEWVLLLLLVAAFAYCLPTLNLYKIDGDAYAVGTFAADALADLPLNAHEPLFGTDLGPGVRMAFNQSLPMAYLWSSLSTIDPITLTAAASRAMVALWVMLATYAFGKAAGAVAFGELHSRRFGLFMTALQMLILLAAPFLRGDNVSLFFFERTTADKYMVPMTMLPLVFAFTLRYLATGQQRTWGTAAVATFAVSTIHPLIAAMMALALGAFAGFHWLLHTRQRTVLLRSLAVIGLTLIAMGLPLIQLVLARTEAPLAPSYPASIDGWPVGYRRVAALPFLYIPTLDIVGPLPDLTQLQAVDADSTLNPFLIWRFAVNMNRRRLLLFDLDHYISDPNIFLEPPYILALLLLPLLLWRIRTNLAAQFAFSVTLAILFVMFNPYVTPLIGALVMPWILWRFVWIFPYTLILALVAYRLLCAWRSRRESPVAGGFYAPLALVLIGTLLASPLLAATRQTLNDRTTFPYEFPVPTHIFAQLQELTRYGDPVNVMAEQDLSVTLAAYVAKANVIAHRVPTTSEIFPADQQRDALQRLIDQARFFRTKYITADTLALLQRYQVAYVIAPSDSELNLQLQLAAAWFTWLADDSGYSLYTVHAPQGETPTLLGNAALLQRLWPTAEAHFQTALRQNPNDLLAKYGQAEIAHMRGQFTEAVTLLQEAAAHSGQPYLHYRLGQLYAEVGRFDRSIAEFSIAQAAAPTLPHFQLALGDACLNAGQMVCAETNFTAVADQSTHTALPTDNETAAVQQQLALADLWRERGQLALALPLYQAAAARQPTLMNQLRLANIYLETDHLVEAEQLLTTLRTQHPLSSDVLLLAARVKSRNGQPDAALALYQQAIRLQDLLAQESVETRLALAATLVDQQRLPEAHRALDEILWRQPNNATAYALRGEVYREQGSKDAAAQAYQRAFTLDPTQVNVYFALNNQLGQRGERQTEVANLLARAMKANPDEAVLALALGDQLEESGRPRSAIAAYHSAIDKFEAYTQPNRLNRQSNQVGRAYAYARLAAVSEDMGEIEPAMNYYAAAAAAAPEFAWPQTILGDALRRRGETAAAVTAYTRAVALDPNSSDAYLRLADLYTAKGDETEAARYRTLTIQTVMTATQAALITPADASLNQPQASAFLPTSSKAESVFASDETTNAGDPTTTAAPTEQPLAALLRSVQRNLIDGENTRLFRLLARLYTTNGQYAEVLQLYQTLIETGVAQGWDATTMAGYYKELGDLYLAQNQTTEAAATYEKAIALDIWWPQLHVGYARALDKLGETEQALAELRQTVSLAPGYVEAQISLANALEQQGEDEKALAINLLTNHIHPGNVHATLALAHLWQRRGYWARAESYYRTSISQTPGTPDAYIDLAALLIGRQRYDEAQTLLEQALALDQENSDTYLQAGLLAQQRNQPALADEYFAKALQLRVDSPAISLNQIDQLERTGAYLRAETFARARLQQHPDDPDLLLRLAALQQRQGHFAQALNTLLALERLQPTDSRVPAAMAELERVQGRSDEALTFYRKAIAMKADVADYYLAASALWVAQGYPGRAITLLQSGLSNVDRPAALYAAMITIEINNGHLDAADALLQQARTAVGDKPEIVVAMGLYLATQGVDQAEAWYQAQLAAQPQVAELYNALGNLYLRSGKPTDALDAFQQAVVLEPANGGHYIALANAQVAAKQITEAIATLQQAMTVEPTLAAAYTNLAALYAQQQAWDEARSLYQQALVVAPTNGLAYVQYAQFLAGRSEPDAANAHLAQADQLSSTAAMLISRAALYVTLNRKPEAEKDLLLALQKEPGNVDALLALNRLYRDLGETDKATGVLAKAMQLVPALGDETIPGVTKTN